MDNSAALRSPSPETIAGFVKLQRAILGWKRETLAALANVSLSTVERVERGESVRPSTLEKLALALGQRHDAFTALRVPLSDEEALASLVESLSWIEGTVPVEVAPLRRETQLRALAETELMIITSDLDGEDAAFEVNSLREYLDLIGFVRAEDGMLLPKRERSFRLRNLYKDVLAAVDNLERAFKAVCLVGTYEAQSSSPRNGTVHIAVVAVRSRERNPSASNIRRLMAEGIVDTNEAIKAFLEGKY